MRLKLLGSFNEAGVRKWHGREIVLHSEWRSRLRVHNGYSWSLFATFDALFHAIYIAPCLMARYADLFQSFFNAHTWLSRHDFGPNRLSQHC